MLSSCSSSSSSSSSNHDCHDDIFANKKCYYHTVFMKAVDAVSLAVAAPPKKYDGSCGGCCGLGSGKKNIGSAAPPESPPKSAAPHPIFVLPAHCFLPLRFIQMCTKPPAISMPTKNIDTDTTIWVQSQCHLSHSDSDSDSRPEEEPKEPDFIIKASSLTPFDCNNT